MPDWPCNAGETSHTPVILAPYPQHHPTQNVWHHQYIPTGSCAPLEDLTLPALCVRVTKGNLTMIAV